MDHLCFISNIVPKSSNNVFSNSLFYRTQSLWNHLPIDVRNIYSLNEFKTALYNHMWKIILQNIDIEIDDEVFID